MNYTPFKKDYRTWEYDRKLKKSLSYKAAEPFHGPYENSGSDKGYILSAPSQGVSTTYL